MQISQCKWFLQRAWWCGTQWRLPEEALACSPPCTCFRVASLNCIQYSTSSWEKTQSFPLEFSLFLISFQPAPGGQREGCSSFDFARREEVGYLSTSQQLLVPKSEERRSSDWGVTWKTLAAVGLGTQKSLALAREINRNLKNNLLYIIRTNSPLCLCVSSSCRLWAES